jgi:hypothetical protein
MTDADKRTSDATVTTTYDTVPDPPITLTPTLGSRNIVLTWQAPVLDGSHKLSPLPHSAPITKYTVDVTPVVGSQFTVLASSANVPCPNTTDTNCYQLNVPGLTNGTAYTFTVRAVNVVGQSDATTAVATPSADAAAKFVPLATSQTLTTCTTAIPTSPTCVQYVIPSGGGGVFGALGNFTFTSNTFCGGLPCFGANQTPNTKAGAVNLGSLAGYFDFKHPLLEIITWDTTTFTAAERANPGSIKIWYQVNQPGSVPGVLPKCVNASYALSKQYGTAGAPATGSACLKKFVVLGGKNAPPNANGDIQFQINLTSDSDALAGHH